MHLAAAGRRLLTEVFRRPAKMHEFRISELMKPPFFAAEKADALNRSIIFRRQEIQETQATYMNMMTFIIRVKETRKHTCGLKEPII
jgi:hypothetical protein